MSFGVRMGMAESNWFSSHGSPVWYSDFRCGFANWLTSRSELSSRCFRTIQVNHAKVMHIMRKASCDPAVLSVSQLNDALINATISAAFENPNSLINQKRGHRSGESFDPFNSALRNYHRAYILVFEYLQLPRAEQMNKKRALHIAKQRCPRTMDMECNMSKVDDALTMDEMTRALDACNDKREYLMIFLLCRLGIRLGALIHIRLAGLIKDYQALRPGLDCWLINDRLVAHDKGDKFNEWNIAYIPEVKEVLHGYVNDYWRPRYERWDDTDSKMPRMKDSLLFPPLKFTTRVRNPLKQYACSAMLTIKRILKTAGIEGARAHAHAFRKGVVARTVRVWCTNDIGTRHHSPYSPGADRASSGWKPHQNCQRFCPPQVNCSDRKVL